MLVECPCGKKLNVNEGLVGKKVRCPVCKEVFVAHDQDSEEEEEARIQEQPSRNKKQTAKAAKQDEDDSFDEEEEEEEPKASRKKGKRGASEKPGIPLWRKLFAGVMLGILLAVLVVVYLRAFAKPGTLKLYVNVPGTKITVDGKKLDFDEPLATEFTFEEIAGDHEVTVSRVNYQTFTEKVTFKSGVTREIQVNLKRNPR